MKKENDLIDSELIQLAYEKGYFEKYKIPVPAWLELTDEQIPTMVDIPTRYELQKWLREEQNIDIDITLASLMGTYKVTLFVKSEISNGDQFVPKKRIGNIPTYNTYEKALDKGLDTGLKLILVWAK